MPVLTSRNNPQVKQIRALRQRKAREEAGMFLVEGIRPIGEAVESGRKIEALCYAPDLLTSSFAKELVEKQRAGGTPCLALDAATFTSLADKDNPQGLIAVLRKPSWELSKLTAENFPWGVAVVEPQDPGNIGAILRTIDAVGASGLILLGNAADPYHPSAVRASMGTLFWHPILHTTFDEFAHWARAQVYTVYGTSARDSLDYRAVERYPSPLIVLLGSEREGLSPEQRQACDLVLRLPMHGRATSLNLAVAAGVILYAMLEKRAAA